MFENEIIIIQRKNVYLSFYKATNERKTVGLLILLGMYLEIMCIISHFFFFDPFKQEIPGAQNFHLSCKETED